MTDPPRLRLAEGDDAYSVVTLAIRAGRILAATIEPVADTLTSEGLRRAGYSVASATYRLREGMTLAEWEQAIVDESERDTAFRVSEERRRLAEEADRAARLPYQCACRARFATPRGLAQHRARSRRAECAEPPMPVVRVKPGALDELAARRARGTS